jgi:SAM-dependent methyltransferase
MSLAKHVKEQLSLFDQEQFVVDVGLDAALWRGSFNGRESTLQQLSPYVGKLKSGMARALITLYSNPGDTVLDPFSGSGVVPLEAALMGRNALANDLSPYAYTLTRGKLEAPARYDQAVSRACSLADEVERHAPDVDTGDIPEWVAEFFHAQTLKEVVLAFRLLREREDYFLLACLCGILHHQRPGFLSYPSSHLVPYLRKSKYPPEEYPSMYEYRDLRSRLLAKVKRAYRRTGFSPEWSSRTFDVYQVNSMDLPIENGRVDAIISSPPYFGALDYARDNRLRLWFLGCEEWKELDSSLTANSKVYLPQMAECIREMHRVLRSGGYCILVLGDVERNGTTRRTAEILSELSTEVTEGRLVTDQIYDDYIPDERRTRRRTSTTKFERILVMHKV